MKSWLGTYYESSGAEPVEASVLAFEKVIAVGYRSLGDGHITFNWNMKDIHAVIQPSSQSTRISNNNAGSAYLLVPGKDAAVFIAEMQQELGKPWHKKGQTKEWSRNLLIFSGIVAVLITAYFLLVPWMAEKMAATVSVKTEEQFGNEIYNAMSLEEAEDTAASAAMNKFFKQLDVPTAYDIQITVVKGEVVNAFALPGGHIVVYSALLEKLQSYPELAALLSHEFTHVNNKHSTKSIFRKLGSRIFIGLLFGKFGSVTSVMIDQADDLKSLTYSRSLEKEADTEGLAILTKRKIDSDGFVQLFQHLKTAAYPSEMPEFLASHPDIDSRINYIREKAKGAEVQEDSQLKTIFDNLKQQ
jgi:Zn-dependent protease with chaperone function